MISEKILHENDLLTVVLYESSVEEDIVVNDYNELPCLSFPLKAGFRYCTTGFDQFIDSNSFLVETQSNELSYTKYHDLGSDLTVCFKFKDHQTFIQSFAKFHSAEAFRLTPQLSYGIYQLIRQSVGDRVQLDTLIDQILFKEIFDESLEKFSPVINKRYCLSNIEAAREFMHGHFTSDITINEIAEASCLSRFHFSRLFKELTGNTPYQYLRQLRFLSACQSLKKDVEITEVAFENGFNSLENFSAAFKNEYGISPKTFRDAQRKSYSLKN